MDDDRRARLRELQAQRRYREALEVARPALSELLGLELTDDDAVSKEAVETGLAAARARRHFHLVWHRVRGVRLRAEVIETCARIGDALGEERAVLIWHESTVGFVVPAQLALLELPRWIGPAEGDVGPGGAASDLLLVADDGDSGLRLEYSHDANADEYELRSWGRYAMSVAR